MVVGCNLIVKPIDESSLIYKVKIKTLCTIKECKNSAKNKQTNKQNNNKQTKATTKQQIFNCIILPAWLVDKNYEKKKQQQENFNRKPKGRSSNAQNSNCYVQEEDHMVCLQLIVSLI